MAGGVRTQATVRDRLVPAEAGGPRVERRRGLGRLDDVRRFARPRTTSITLNDRSYEACVAKRAREGLVEQCELVKGDFYHYRNDAPFDGITNMGVTEHLTD